MGTICCFVVKVIVLIGLFVVGIKVVISFVWDVIVFIVGVVDVVYVCFDFSVQFGFVKGIRGRVFGFNEFVGFYIGICCIVGVGGIRIVRVWEF